MICMPSIQIGLSTWRENNSEEVGDLKDRILIVPDNNPTRDYLKCKQIHQRKQ